jgi:hypothetical protein
MTSPCCPAPVRYVGDERVPTCEGCGKEVKPKQSCKDRFDEQASEIVLNATNGLGNDCVVHNVFCSKHQDWKRYLTLKISNALHQTRIEALREVLLALPSCDCQQMINSTRYINGDEPPIPCSGGYDCERRQIIQSLITQTEKE